METGQLEDWLAVQELKLNDHNIQKPYYLLYIHSVVISIKTPYFLYCILILCCRFISLTAVQKHED